MQGISTTAEQARRAAGPAGQGCAHVRPRGRPRKAMALTGEVRASVPPEWADRLRDYAGAEGISVADLLRMQVGRLLREVEAGEVQFGIVRLSGHTSDNE